MIFGKIYLSFFDRPLCFSRANVHYLSPFISIFSRYYLCNRRYSGIHFPKI